MWWTSLIKFLKGKLSVIAIVVVLLLTTAIGLQHFKIKILKKDLSDQENVVAILTNEYEEALTVAEHNRLELDKAELEHNRTIYILNEKHKEDLERVKATSVILERTTNVDEEDDGNVSNILRSTLDALRVLE